MEGKQYKKIIQTGYTVIESGVLKTDESTKNELLDAINCNTCSGSGRVRKDQFAPRGSSRMRCPDCGGKGTV